ncbi:MAG TPA: hypothetical protein VGN19_01980 [Pedococcus sp.]|nr:hypothetical protein [Pedococcus sp.]
MPGSTEVSDDRDVRPHLVAAPPTLAAGDTTFLERRPLGALWLAPGLLGAAGAACWSTSPVIGVTLVVLGVVLVWRRRVPTHVAVIAVSVAYLALWCALGLVAAISHLPMFTTSLGWWLGWAAVTGAAVVIGGRPLGWVAARRPVLGANTPGGPDVGLTRIHGPARWAFAPAAAFALLASFQSLSAELAGRWLTLATDPMQLILLMQQMGREGALEYGRNLGTSGDLAGEVYPKGLHWLITASLGPATDPSAASPETLALYLRTFAGFIWLSVALLLCLAAGLFLAAARRWDLRTGTALASTGWLTALLVCVAQFGGVVVVQGAAASALAVGCVWALWWTALVQPRVRIVTAVVSSALFVTANMWQPMVPVMLVAGAVLLWPQRHGIRRWLRTSLVRGWPAVAAVATVGTLAVAVTASPVTALLLAGGASVAAMPGGIQKPFLPSVGVEIALALAVLLRSRDGGHRQLLATIAGVAAATSIVWLIMAIAAGVQPFAYYPSKVLWFLTLSGWPFVAGALGIATTHASSWLSGRRHPVRWITSKAPAAVACSGLALLSIVFWWGWRFPSQLVAAATGNLTASVPMALSGLPVLPGGYYMPYLLGPATDRTRTQEYEAAKILAFRFGTPYLPWGTQVPVCHILRSRSPVVLVTTQTRAIVSSALRDAHCTLTGWQMLQIPLRVSPAVRFETSPHPRYRG